MVPPAAVVCWPQRVDGKCCNLSGGLERLMVAYDMSLQSWKKPFNPLLGETWQAQQAGGGCQIFMEQLSHHPPISAFEMIGPSES
jgi:Oxysterol-binding protein